MALFKWKPEALLDLEKLDTVIVKRILKKMEWLEENFDYVVPEKLKATPKNTYKFRIGDYRIIYTIEKNMVFIVQVDHRRDVYKNLRDG